MEKENFEEFAQQFLKQTLWTSKKELSRKIEFLKRSYALAIQLNGNSVEQQQKINQSYTTVHGILTNVLKHMQHSLEKGSLHFNRELDQGKNFRVNTEQQDEREVLSTVNKPRQSLLTLALQRPLEQIKIQSPQQRMKDQYNSQLRFNIYGVDPQKKRKIVSYLSQAKIQ